MKIQLQEKFIMKYKAQREVLSGKASLFRVSMCAPPSNKYLTKSTCRNERTSLWVLKRGSLTIEAALIVPFFLVILLAFFSYFLQYASAAELKVQAAAEAKKAGIVLGSVQKTDSGDVTIYKSAKIKEIWEIPFIKENHVTQKAVCRAWIGFTELETEETYVYITQRGSVYHLYNDCTHLDLSIQRVTFAKACSSKNAYGERYRECELCDTTFGALVYITKEGNCYHSERSCSGLKRTIRQIPLSEVEGRTCCIRCMSREE